MIIVISTMIDQMITVDEFFSAMVCGDIDVITMALGQGFNINEQSSYSGQSALHMACSCSRVNVVKLLVNKGADCTITDKYECTPLRVAIAYATLSDNPDCISIVRILLHKTNNDTGYLEIIHAIEILGKQKRLFGEDYELLYQLSYYRNWKIRLAVIEVLINHGPIPMYLTKRMIELQNDDHPKVVKAVNILITAHNIKQPNLMDRIQDSYSQLWKYLIASYEEDTTPLLTNFNDVRYLKER